MYAKTDIFNLALNALLLSRQISNTDTDTSNECKVLNTNWNAAFISTLASLDLDSTSTASQLQLIQANPVPQWNWAYGYPANCAFLRRIKPHGFFYDQDRNHCTHDTETIDNRATQVPRHVAIWNNQKVIFCNKQYAWAEIITSTLPLSVLNAPTGLAIAMRLAWLASPLVVGKGAQKLREEIDVKFKMFKAEAQDQDVRENEVLTNPQMESEFVLARTT